MPSGMLDMGLSDAALDHLRTLAEPHCDTPTFDAAWGNLSVRLSPWRPLARLRAEPCLFAQNTMGDFALGDHRLASIALHMRRACARRP